MRDSLIRLLKSWKNAAGAVLLEVDGQWLTFPFPFVHHQPLNISLVSIHIQAFTREINKGKGRTLTAALHSGSFI